jgi:hypothetical protein
MRGMHRSAPNRLVLMKSLATYTLKVFIKKINLFEYFTRKRNENAIRIQSRIQTFLKGGALERVDPSLKNGKKLRYLVSEILSFTNIRS